MAILTAIAAAILASVTPLTPDQRVALETAYDGRDHQESAFDALLENVGSWTEGIGDEPVRLEPDFEAMLNDPGGYRGELCRISGRLEQQSWLAPPHQDVAEWFIRGAGDEAIALYVCGLGADRQFDDGAEIVVHARFYKRIDADARDGERHRYAAFVGAFPEFAGGPAQSAGGFALILVIPVAVLLFVFMVLLVYVRRSGKANSRGHRRADVASQHEVDASPPLPDDPAEALSELRQRSETT